MPDQLALLGYGGPDAARQFQRHAGLDADGIVGPKTTAALSARASASLPGRSYRPFRLTDYYATDEADYPPGTVPVLDAHGEELRRVSPSLFNNMALEGTGRFKDGTLLNVDGGTYVPVDKGAYAGCAAAYQSYAASMRSRGLNPKPPRYFGVDLDGDGDVRSAQPFLVVPESQRGKGYGIGRGGIPYDPFRTLAADLGAYSTSDPRFRDKGGLVPVGTRVHVVEFAGAKLPDGTTHDGWFTVDDTGGGIFGAHFDVFNGSRSLMRALKMAKPGWGHVSFDGIEARVPVGYTLGLEDR